MEHQFLFYADDAVVGAAHAHIGLEGGAVGKNPLVRGGNVRVRAENCRHAAVEVPAHGDFLAGRFCVEVDDDHSGANGGKQSIGCAKGIVDRRHEDAALQLQHGEVDARRRFAFVVAVTRQAGWKVGRPQHAPRLHLRVWSSGVQIFVELSLIPDMIAGGQYVGAPLENLFGDLRRDAETARGILDIDDREIDVVRRAYVADVLAHDFASRAAEDVADEQDIQWCPGLL